MSNIIVTALVFLILGIFLFIISIILCNYVSYIFKKRYNNIIIGVIGLLIFIVGKYIWYIINIVQNEPPANYLNAEINPLFWSNLLIANVSLVWFPDLLLLLMSVALIFDKSKAWIKIFAPYGLFFGMLYLICSTFIYTTSSYVANFNMDWWQFTFIGDGLTRMPSITFIYLMLISLFSLIANKEYTRWSIISTIIFGGILVLYASLFQQFKDVGANGLSALSYSGLSNGYNADFGEFFKNYFFAFGQALSINANPEKAWIGTLTIYMILIAYLILLFLAKNLLTKDLTKINYIYYPWYHNSKLFRNIFASIDASINNFLYKFLRNSYLFGINPKDLPIIIEFLEMLQNNKITNNVDVDRLIELINALKIKKVKVSKQKKIDKKIQEKKLYDHNFYSFDNLNSNDDNKDVNNESSIIQIQ